MSWASVGTLLRPGSSGSSAPGAGAGREKRGACSGINTADTLDTQYLGWEAVLSCSLTASHLRSHTTIEALCPNDGLWPCTGNWLDWNSFCKSPLKREKAREGGDQMRAEMLQLD